MAKFVHPEVVRVPSTMKDTERIEVAGRTCYNSLDKIKIDSDIKFCKFLINKGHEAVIEFASFITQFDETTWRLIKSSNPKFLNFSSFKNRYLISGNARAWRDYLKNGAISYPIRQFILLQFRGHVLFEDIPFGYRIILPKNIRFNFVNEKKLLPEEEKLHQYMHFYVTTDRGVMAELTRHRPDISFAIQSTRYVNFKSGCEFIIPQWQKKKPKEFLKKVKHSLAKFAWRSYCRASERGYKLLLMLGLQPQNARGLLPNSLKTIINVCATRAQFDIIFGLRSSDKAHPDIKFVSDKMRDGDYELWNWQNHTLNYMYRKEIKNE